MSIARLGILHQQNEYFGWILVRPCFCPELVNHTEEKSVWAVEMPTSFFPTHLPLSSPPPPLLLKRAYTKAANNFVNEIKWSRLHLGNLSPHFGAKSLE